MTEPISVGCHPSISAVICTRNRAGLLPKAIESLADQTLAKEQYEILVVDNGSTDDTRLAVEMLSRSEPGLIRYLYEEHLGLAYARNTGAAQARGRWVAYLDDDARAAPEWLQALATALEALGDAGCVGGPILPLWEVPPPAWLGSRLYGYLSLLNLEDVAGVIPLSFPSHCPFGANMAFPRELLMNCGGFAPDLGRVGTFLLSAEEVDLFHRLVTMGKQLYYVPAAAVQHFIPSSRLTKAFFRRRSFWGGRSALVLQGHFSPYRRLIVNCAKQMGWKFPAELAQAIILGLHNREQESLYSECQARSRLGYLVQFMVSTRHGFQT